MKGCEFFSSTLGKKFLVAVTGVLLFGFVLMHMLGNLKAFAGIDPDSGLQKLDAYAHFLRVMGAPFFGHGQALWAARIGLILIFVLHVVSIVQLKLRNSAARPVGYRAQQFGTATYAARSMFWGGLLILVFVVYHILHFTTGQLHYQGFVDGMVYQNVHSAFTVAWQVALYCGAMLILGLHLYHGLWSLFQTLGLDNPRWNKTLRGLACGFSAIVFIGFISVPLAVFFQLLK